jgi:hypothetical protein
MDLSLTVSAGVAFLGMALALAFLPQGDRRTVHQPQPRPAEASVDVA